MSIVFLIYMSFDIHVIEYIW